MSAPEPGLRLALTTVPDLAVAKRLAHALVEARVAACVNVVPGVTSVYRWRGAVEEASECLLVVKTSAERVGDLEAALRAAHPYEVPEFVVVDPERVAPGYLDWVRSETR